MTRERMTVLIDEALNFLKPGNDALLARRPARFFLASTSTPSSSRRTSSSSVNLGASNRLTAGLRRRKGRARAIRNHLRFVLGDGRHDVDRETVRLREIHCFKFDL